MKNGDKCAYPFEGNEYNKETPCPGLTKREIFAMAALHTVLNKYDPYEHGDFDSSEWGLTAKNAVGLADALLKELDK